MTGRSSGPPRYASLRLGTVRLGLAEAPPVGTGLRHPPTGSEHVVEVADIHSYRDALVAAGVSLAADPTERPWGLTDLRVLDPDGYYWRFTSRRE